MKRYVAVLVMVLLALPSAHAVAGKKRHKKPKPWTSEEGTIAVAHPVFYGNSGEVLGVTVQEFENTCSIPASQGVDAYVFEVPAAYQKMQANLTAVGSGADTAGYDLDMFLYDADCQLLLASQAEGTDEYGVLMKGTAYVAVGNYLGDPDTTVQIEIKP